MSRILGHVYEDGEVIVHEGEQGACMFVIQRGEVAVTRADAEVGQNPFRAGDKSTQRRVQDRGL